MADILTLAEARKALRLPAADTSPDADLTATYIPATTQIVESLAGPQVQASSQTFTADGGATSIMLPSAVASIQSVTENGLALSSGDWFADLEAGIVYRGQTTAVTTFASGMQNIVVTYTVGAASVPEKIKLAARIILASLYQADQQGEHSEFAAPNGDMVMTSVGYLIPRRAYRALVDEDVAGFA